MESAAAAGDRAIVVRRLRAAEWRLLRDIRLRGLAEVPEAFGQSLADAEARPDEEWRAAARQAATGDRRAWFVAERMGRGGRPAGAVGIISGRRRPPDTVMVFSMWVDPAERRAGVGRQLIAAVDGWAASWGGTTTVLWVFASNEPAIRFYGRIGFETVREGPDAEAGTPYGAVAMRRPIAAG